MTDPSDANEELLQRRPIIITGLRRITKLISKDGKKSSQVIDPM